MVALKSARFLVGSFVFCVVSPWSFAVRAQACDKNEDCSGTAVCYELTIPKCTITSAPACAPNEKCEAPAPEPASCVDVTEKLCVARYLLPCQADTDCGDGFTCEANMECSCSGSGGSGSSDPAPRADAGAATADDAGVSYKAGFAPVPSPQPAVDGGVAVDAAVGGQPPTCECHALETKHCVAKTITCSSDSECPSDFVCVSNTAGATDCAVSKDADAAVCGTATQSSTDKVCAPRSNWTDYGTDRGGVEQGTDHESSASGSSKDSTEPSAPPAANGGADAGVVSGAPEQDAGAMPATNHTDCSVATPGSSNGSANTGLMLGFALLALGLTRKRTSR